MNKAIFFLFLGCLQSYAWDVGFDFRATQSFVTDPAYAVFASNASYPTTLTVNGQEIRFGWESFSLGYLTRDRSTSVDPRLAGISCNLNDGSTSVFRVDLPANGSYQIGIAVGDALYDQSNHIAVASDTTRLLAIDAASTAGFFADAMGTPWNAGAWPASNVTVQKIFGATILRVTLGGTADSGFTCAAHLRVTSGQAPAPVMSAWQYFIL